MARLETILNQCRNQAIRDQEPHGVKLLASDNYATLVHVGRAPRLAPLEPRPQLPQNQWTTYLEITTDPVTKTTTYTQVGVSLKDNGIQVGDMVEQMEWQALPNKIKTIDYVKNSYTLHTDMTSPHDFPIRLGNNYRYIPTAYMPLMGDAPITLYNEEYCNIDITKSLNVPLTSGQDILLVFGPNGRLLGSTTTGQVVLWIAPTLVS